MINNFRSVKLYKHSFGQKLAINYAYLDTKLMFTKLCESVCP